MAGKTCIFGSATIARQVADHLLTAGTGVIIVTNGEKIDLLSSTDTSDTDNNLLEIFTNTKLHSCKYSAGNFTLNLSANGVETSRQVSSIVIAEKEQRVPNHSIYGLTPSTAVIPLSRHVELLGSETGIDSLSDSLRHVVYLSGLITESNVEITKEVMRSSLTLQTDLNLQTYILTNNLKVAGDGLEKLYRQTKEAGTFYVKFSGSLPEIRQDKDGRVRIEFVDDITGHEFRLQPDLVVVDESIWPAVGTKKLAEILELETDPNGFLQADNVHRLTGFTNRKGILVAGPARAVLAPDDQKIDADSVAESALGLNRFPSAIPDDRAQIDTGQCVRCLTCFRLCPYRAIQLNTRVNVISEACERCGICAAECPRGAIRIPGMESDDIAQQYGAETQTAKTKSAAPFIVAFCCSRSANPAGELAKGMGLALPAGLKIVQVPCAGSISLEHVLGAFTSGAEGVLLLTCHEGNCHSERGNVRARQRARQLTDLFSTMGFDSKRLEIQSLASNMGMEFAEIVNRFEQGIRDLVKNS